MSQVTFPKFTNMIPNVEDLQIIVDSFRQEDRNRITRDGIFNPGIVNKPADYLSNGTSKNSLKIKPFIAYTLNGDRIEVESTWDNLFPTGNIITVTNENNVSSYTNIPVWYSYNKNYSNLTDSALSQTIQLSTLGKGSILHGIKLKINELFNVTGQQDQPNIFVSIGTNSEPEKFLPNTLISQINSDESDISIMNIMYCANDDVITDIVMTFSSDTVNLNTLSSGSLTINLCVANLSGFDNSALETVDGGYKLSTTSLGSWQKSTTYHIVARYIETESNPVNLSYTDSNGTAITTDPENTRVTTAYAFFALRKTGTTIDYTTSNDIKLGEVQTDINGDIYALNINGVNPRTNENYTQYLTIPGYRYTNNIDATQIADGSVDNTKFQYLNTLTGNVQSQLNSKANLNTDNVFTGNNTFEQQIQGDIKTVNGFTAYATPTKNSLLVLDENGKIPAQAISESTVASIGNLYTVSSGVLKNGRSAFLEANSSKNGVIVKAGETPLVLNYPDGTVEKINQDQEIDGLSADGYYYLVKELNGNFVFLPTAGGTKSCIPVVGSGNSFSYEGELGTVYCFYENSTAYKAFDGNTTTFTNMGKVFYKNYNNIEQESYLPSGTATYLEITFPKAVSPTGFSACFRKNQDDITPKAWIFEGKNDSDEDWTQIYSVEAGNPSTWNIGEIKYVDTPSSGSFTKFRFIFNVNETTINNYMKGEETPASGVNLPINCYYFQMYANNTDTANKGNIVEGYVKPTGMSVGSYFLDISKKPYIGYKNTGASGEAEFVEQQFVKLGFVELIGYDTDNQILNVYPFCYNTFTLSDDDKLIIKNTPITFDHNLGIVPNIINIKFKCLKENNGYLVGDYISEIYTNIPDLGLRSIKDIYNLSVTSLQLNTGLATDTLKIYNKARTALVDVVDEDWSAIIYCARGW